MGSSDAAGARTRWLAKRIRTSLRRDCLDRLEAILDRADELGMVAIVGYFYFGQDERLRDEAAVIGLTSPPAANTLRGATLIIGCQTKPLTKAIRACRSTGASVANESAVFSSC